MIIFLRFAGFVVGLTLIIGTLASAIRTFVLPRGSADFITGSEFRLIRWFFSLLLRRTKSYVTRDRFMALYAPISVLVLLPVCLILVSLRYPAMFWATGIDNLTEAFTISGSFL